MCCGCWQEMGAYRIDNALVREIARLHADVWEYGPLHVVVADDNLTDNTLDFCKEHALARYWHPTDEAFWQAMKRATWEERVSACGLWNGCWK